MFHHRAGSPLGVTLKHVAKRANVALGTASRVINGHPDVNPRLRLRVEKVIQELNYRPNARARSFVRDSSPVLSFILSNRNFLHPVHSRILQGVEEYCEEVGYFVLFTKFDYTPEISPRDLGLPRVLRSHGIADCVILAGTNYDCFVDALEKLRIPHVLLGNNFITNRNREPVDQVCSDDIVGAYEMTQYLIQLGHEHIWYIGDTSLLWFKWRYDGYCQAMIENRLEPLGCTVGLSDNYFAHGYACTELLLEERRPVTAVFAGADDIAFGAWDCLTKKGIGVPRDLTLVGFNDDEDAQYKIPALTTVRVDRIELGRQLAMMAINKIKSPGKRFPEIVIPVTLMRRGTARPLVEARHQSPPTDGA